MAKQEPEKLSGTSFDISAENRAQLKQLFPTVFTETKNDKGDLVESIDFEKLKAEVGTFSDFFESRRERYGMDWPGKKEALRLIQTPSYATLKPCREESINFDITENLFIEGDNLEVLKLLQKSYYGKIKMIYIDPPYNTGNEFIYPDNFTESLETYLEYAGIIDGDGKKFSTNTSNEGRFHTKWLNMMYPRLYLARNLLRDDGLFFISIDDNEVSNLKKVCDEIFGEENFISEMVWKNKTGGGAKTKGWIGLHEYILCYVKNIESIIDVSIPYSEKTASMYNKKDENYSTRGPYATWPLDTTSMGDRPNLRFPIIYDGKEIWPEKQWLWSQERVIEAQKNGMLEFNKQKDDSYNIRFKGYLRDENGIMRRGKPLSLLDGPYTQEGSGDFQELLQKSIFPFPKPVRLLSQIFSISTTNGKDSNDIILDFFSGSSTTAHAVLDLNKDGGNRKFILVQLPEPCAPDSDAFKAGYKTIADIGKERIRRVIKKLDTENNKEQQDTPPRTFQERGTMREADLGFKVLKLDKSNFKQWQKLDPSTPPEQIEAQLELHIDHVSHLATPEDLLYEILLKAGFTPTEKIEIKTIAGKSVFSVAEGSLLLCLEDKVTQELIDVVAEAEPMQFICLDSAFHGNDQLKANAVQTFASRNMQKEKHNQIVFKTV